MKKAVLKLYGEIGEEIPDSIMGEAPDRVSAKMVSDFLDKNSDATELVVRINSVGGDVQEGWLIHDLIATSGKKIKTIGEGRVYSIATVIFLAGDEREMLKNADGIIHNPYIPPYTLAGAYGAGDLTEIAETLKQEEKKMLDYYVERTGVAEDKLAAYMAKDTKLSAEDMLSLNFATKIIEPVKAFAYIKPKNNFIMTEADVKTFGEKLDAIIAKVAAFTRLSPADQTLKDKDGKEFKLEKESGAPAVGDKASPDGTYVMDNGKTITIAAGAITTIVEPVAQKTEIEIANEKIAALETEITSLKAEKPDLVAAEAAFKEQETAAKNLAEELKALKNTWRPDSRTRFSSAEKVGDINLTQVKELSKKIQ